MAANAPAWMMLTRRLENQLSDLLFPARTNAANERLAQHL
jgi:hypothetical protein